MRSAAERGARGVVLALIASAILAAVPTGAAAATRAQVCVSRTAVVHSPGGFTVGYLYRRDRVVVLRRSANRVWVRVRTRAELRGWVRTRTLCRVRRSHRSRR